MHLNFSKGGEAVLEICEMAIEEIHGSTFKESTEIQVSD